MLTSSELALYDAAVDALASPLDYAEADAWRAAVNRAVRSLFRADMATFILPIAGSRVLFSDEMDTDRLQEYPEIREDLDAKLELPERELELEVFNRLMLWDGLLHELYRSAYYNDFVVPLRGFDPLSMTTRTPEGLQASLILHHDRPHGERFGRRGLLIMRLLLPAFRAGIRNRQAFESIRAEAARLVDMMRDAVILLDRRGGVVHRNPSASRLIDADPDGRLLVHESIRAAAALGEARSSAGLDPRALSPLERVFRTRIAGYRARACHSPGVFGTAIHALVTLERIDRDPAIAADDIRARFGLTRAESRVAMLLAERRSTAEIARLLVISPHTARHHTSRVLDKLGIRRRAEVGGVLAMKRQPSPVGEEVP